MSHRTVPSDQTGGTHDRSQSKDILDTLCIQFQSLEMLVRRTWISDHIFGCTRAAPTYYTRFLGFVFHDRRQDMCRTNASTLSGVYVLWMVEDFDRFVVGVHLSVDVVSPCFLNCWRRSWS